MKLIKWIILPGLFLSTSIAISATYDNLIVFGDSLSDSGNNTWVKVEGKIGAPITTQDSLTHQRLLWTDYLIKDTALFASNPNQTQFIYPSYQASQEGYSPLKYSMSYAWASAETGARYTNDLAAGYPYNDSACETVVSGQLSPNSSCVPGVLLQIKQYLNDVQNHPNTHSLFIIWAGGNDIFNNIDKVASRNKNDSKPLLLLKMLNVPFPVFSKTETKEPLSKAVKNLKQAVVMLIQAGVPPQNIYVINLPDLAKTPAAQNFAQGNKIILYSLTAITEIFNAALRIDLAFNYLNPTFNLPTSHIISANQLFRDILKNYQTLGFNQLLRDCVQDNAIPDCKGYIFYNAKHPTTAAQQEMAKYISQILRT